MLLPVRDGLVHGKQGLPERMRNAPWTELSQEA